MFLAEEPKSRCRRSPSMRGAPSHTPSLAGALALGTRTREQTRRGGQQCCGEKPDAPSAREEVSAALMCGRGHLPPGSS